MATYQIRWNPTTRTATVQEDGAAAGGAGSVISSFDHDASEGAPIGSGVNHVFYHHVQEALYKTPHEAEGVAPVMYPDGVYNMQNVIIVDEVSSIPLQGIGARPRTMELEVGDTDQIDLLPQPYTAVVGDVTYESDDEDVATVSAAGLVTALVEGEAVITVTTDVGGFTDTVAVTVVPAE